MERIECQWCEQENTPDRTECVNCGGPLHVKDRVGEPSLSAPSMPPPPPPSQFNYPPAMSYPGSYPGPPPQRWSSGRRATQWIGILCAVAVVAVALVVAHIAQTSHHASSRSSSASAPPLDVFSPAGLNSVLTGIRNQYGDTMGYQLILGPDHNDAEIFRADPNHPGHHKLYAYVNNMWNAEDSADPVPPAGEAVADLSKFDVTAVTATLKGAPQSLGMTDVKTTTLLLVSGVADGSLKLSANIGGPGGYDGIIDINQDGSVKALHPPT